MALYRHTTYTDHCISKTRWPKSRNRRDARGAGEVAITRHWLSRAGLKESAGIARRGARAVFQKQDANDPLIVPAVAPHAMIRFRTSAQSAGHLRIAIKALEINLSETKAENDEAIAKAHMTPTAAWIRWEYFLAGRWWHGVWPD